MTVNLPTHDDEIDLRAIFLTIWKARLAILIVTVVAALAAYAVSAWFLPKQYRAFAYVTVIQPSTRYLTGEEGGLSIVPVPPDIKALPELVKTNAILDQVANDSRIAPLLGSKEEQLANKMQVAAVGVSQVRFQVTDTVPERAAALATVWAEKAADWIEENYGSGRMSATLTGQVEQTQKDYAQAQTALEAFLAQDPTAIVQGQFDAQKQSYICLDEQTRTINRFLQRLDDMEARLSQSEGILYLSDTILLSSLQQDIASLAETCNETQPILLSSPPMLFTDLSVSQGVDIIASLRQSLEQRMASNQEEQNTLQTNILKLQVELEHLAYQRAEYTRQRDQASKLYQELTYQKSVMENAIQQSGRVAVVSAEAKAPKAAFSPSPLVNAGVAGVMGLAISMFGVLLADWLKKNGTPA